VLAQEVAQADARLVGLGRDQGQGIGILGTSDGVGFNYQIRGPGGEKAVEHLGGGAIEVGVVAVLVEIRPFPETLKAEPLGAGLLR
jgi:hypothetical protein